MAVSANFDMSSFMSTCFDTLGESGNNLNAKLDGLGSGADGEEIGPEEMLQLQFSIGQYNTLVESMSNVTKSVTDAMKSVAQRAS